MDIHLEDPREPDAADLLRRHLNFCHSVETPNRSFALDVNQLLRPEITLFGARDAGVLLGVCALSIMSPEHGELKSMHVLPESRGQGCGALLVNHVIEYARNCGLERVSLETGPHDAFASARKLYLNCGFEYCGPFGDYPDIPTSVFMTMDLRPAASAALTD